MRRLRMCGMITADSKRICRQGVAIDQDHHLDRALCLLRLAGWPDLHADYQTARAKDEIARVLHMARYVAERTA